MTTKKIPEPAPDEKEQSQRFIETAKILGVDESGKVFERVLKIIAPKKVAKTFERL